MNRLTRTIRTAGRAAILWLSDDVGRRAAKEIITMGMVDTPPKGYIRTHYDEVDSVWRRAVLERQRLFDYLEEWTAYLESAIVFGAFKALAEDATSQIPVIKCKDTRALDNIYETLDRIEYWEKRFNMMRMLNVLGDCFQFCDIDYRPRRKWDLAEIRSLRFAPAWTMFRLDNERGYFANPDRAYLQIPKIELYGFSGQAKNGSLLWTGDGKFLAGGVDKNLYNRYRFEYDGKGRETFRAEEVIHARLNPEMTPIPTGYGVPGRMSARKATDIVTMCTDDAAIGRKLATFNRLHHNLEDASKEDLEDYQKKLSENEPKPWTQYTTRGKVTITAVDAQNNQLQEIKDLHFHVDNLELAMGYPLALVGYRGDRVTGEMAARLDERLNATIRAQNNLEESQFLKPLIFRILYFMGKADTKFEIVWPRGPRLGDQNKFAKRVYTEMEMEVLSREKGLQLLYDWTADEIEENFQQIEREKKRLGPMGKRDVKPEGARKGGKGVENEDTANQDIADTESISDEEK